MIQWVSCFQTIGPPPYLRTILPVDDLYPGIAVLPVAKRRGTSQPKFGKTIIMHLFI